MKKMITLVAGLALVTGATVFGTSCNKSQDWNCKCKDNLGNEETTVIRDKTRKEAKAECDSKINFLGIERECKLSLF